MSCPAVMEFWKRPRYFGSLSFGAEAAISTSPMVETPPSAPWMSLRVRSRGRLSTNPMMKKMTPLQKIPL